jgi:hypothetical protein
MEALNHTVVHLTAYSELILKSFGKETLLFHSASGDTLLLNPSAVPMINYLREGARDKQSLFELVASDLNYEVDVNFLNHMEEVLSGLIKRDIVASR